MKNRLVALALSVMLCNGLTIVPVVWAAGSISYENVPMIKSSISQNISHVELTQGKAQIVRLNQPATRVSISNPDIVGLVLISPTEVELIGKAVGVANLLVWSERSGQNYLTIDLSVHKDVSTLARKIQMIDPGINILPVAAEDSVILTGVAESIEKAQLAYDLAKAFFNAQPAGGGGAAGAMMPPAGGSGGASAGGGASSNSAGSSTFAATSTKIINLIRIIGQPSTKAEMVQERLKEDIDPNITLNVVPGFGGQEKAILMGRVKNASMISKAVNLTSIFYGTPGIKVVTGPGGNVIKNSDEEKGSGGTSFAAHETAGLIGNMQSNILHGSVITDTSGNVVSMLEVVERPQVKCTIKFLEVRKNNFKDFGSGLLLTGNDVHASGYAPIDSTGSSDARQLTSEFVRQISGVNSAQLGILYGSDLASLMNGLIRDGKARVLAEPTITAISGEPATFLAGGEFPVPLSYANGQMTVQYREFGIRLHILPTVTDRGTIHMQVSPEVSSLDPAAGITFAGFNIPGLRARKSQTVVEMRDGENFVMSGLYNQDMTDEFLKTPILGQIPIIGNLFRSRAYRNAETEMVIVIHPEVQHDMDLTYTKPLNDPPKQATKRLNPDEVFSQLKAAKKNESSKILKSTETPTQWEEEEILPAVEKTEAIKEFKKVVVEKDSRKMLRKLKKEQRDMQKLSNSIQKGKSVDDKAVQTVEEKNSLKSEALPEVQQIMYKKDEEYMKNQKDVLANLIQELESKKQQDQILLMMEDKQKQPEERDKVKSESQEVEKRQSANLKSFKRIEQPQAKAYVSKTSTAIGTKTDFKSKSSSNNHVQFFKTGIQNIKKSLPRIAENFKFF